MRVAVIGGGAAGFFAALTCAEQAPNCQVAIFESGPRSLAKVAISGGGRCNVTHNCFEPNELIKNYPRGFRELCGPFSRFQPQDTVNWFAARGVALKAEEDGRMFPVTDNSDTIVNCLMAEMARLGISLRLRSSVREISKIEKLFSVRTTGDTSNFDYIVLATGGSPAGRKFAEVLGHTITECAPSLFTFNCDAPLIRDLAGISFPAVELFMEVAEGEKFKQCGPLLITHWGISGPAVLKLSAFAARELARQSYEAELKVNWLGAVTFESACKMLESYKAKHPTRSVVANPLWNLPKRFWDKCVFAAGIEEQAVYQHISQKDLRTLAAVLTQSKLRINGKGEFKEEFVTCGGIALSEIDMRTMESKKTSGLYAAGEILDIDGITGGFNFQSAWTTGWLAGQAIAQRISNGI